MGNEKTEVFRIFDRFKITGRGPVYMLQDYLVNNLKLDDILYDLQGNRFKVTGIEHFGCNLIGDYNRHMPVGVLFEKMDGIDAEGFILLRKQPNINFLYSNHPLYQDKVDENYEKEYNTAKKEHSCALFSYDDVKEGELTLYGDEIYGLTIYRGPMMASDKYRVFYQKLEEKGIILINSPEEYDRCNMLSGWYSDFKEYTAESLCKKDDGYCEKSEISFSEEYRVFIFANTVMAIENCCSPRENVELSECERLWIQHKVQKVRSNFATMDIVRRDADELIIMGMGDGQVSGVPQIDPEMFYRHFNPLHLWLDDIPAEDFLPEGAVIMGADPIPEKSIEEMRTEVEEMIMTRDLVAAYVSVHNKFWYIEDEIYDYTEGTEEYLEVSQNIDAWGELMDSLEERLFVLAKEEGLIAEELSNAGTIKKLELFMDKYGYRDGAGWWVKKEGE